MSGVAFIKKYKRRHRRHINHEDYFTAITEGIKRYIYVASTKSGIPRQKAVDVLSGSFGRKGKLSVFNKYMQTRQFTEQTQNDIEQGQQELSLGLLRSFRNTISHEEVKALSESGALTYQDCLDALSILSYLMRRLSEAEVRTTDE